MRPEVILCDIDGTVALRRSRGPYDWDKVDRDDPNVPVIKVITGIREMFPVIFLSGRMEQARKLTHAWIMREMGIWAHEGNLLMRKDGDFRSDVDVKLELYQERVEPNFRIVCVFDDRNSVVAMWRRIGLPCLQVAEGDF